MADWLSTYLPTLLSTFTYFYFLALLRIVLASPLLLHLASPELLRFVMYNSYSAHEEFRCHALCSNRISTGQRGSFAPFSGF